MTKADQLARALDEFLATSPDIEAAAVVSADGLPMASALPPHVEEDRLAAMSAAILTLGERAAIGLGKGGLSQVFVEGEDGYVVLMAAGDNAVLVAVTSQGAKVGLLLFEMRRAASRVGSVMEEAPPPPPAPVEAAHYVEEVIGAVGEPVAVDPAEPEQVKPDAPESSGYPSEAAPVPTFASNDTRPPAPIEFEPGNTW